MVSSHPRKESRTARLAHMPTASQQLWEYDKSHERIRPSNFMLVDKQFRRLETSNELPCKFTEGTNGVEYRIANGQG